MATASSQSSAFGTQAMTAAKADSSEEEANMEKARKNHASWVVGAAVLRLTKMCAPRCMDYERVQIGRDERECLDKCVRDLHNVNEATLRFFRDFESDMSAKQATLVKELADDFQKEKQMAKQVAKQEHRKQSGYVRL